MQEDELHKLMNPDDPEDLLIDGDQSLRQSSKQLSDDKGKPIMDSTLLDQSIKMLCDTHKAPAVFFSNKEDRYVCFKCLVASEKLLYIDKSYKNEMEDFERIKEFTAEAVRSNLKNTTIIKKWKLEVRACLMRVRDRFNENIDKFIYQFSSMFKDVEQSKDLQNFKLEDKRLHS